MATAQGAVYRYLSLAIVITTILIGTGYIHPTQVLSPDYAISTASGFVVFVTYVLMKHFMEMDLHMRELRVCELRIAWGSDSDDADADIRVSYQYYPFAIDVGMTLELAETSDAYPEPILGTIKEIQIPYNPNLEGGRMRVLYIELDDPNDFKRLANTGTWERLMEAG